MSHIESLGETIYWLWMLVPFSHWRMLFLFLSSSVCLSVRLLNVHTHLSFCVREYYLLSFFFLLLFVCQSYIYTSSLYLNITEWLWYSQRGKVLFTDLKHWDHIQESLKKWASSFLCETFISPCKVRQL